MKRLYSANAVAFDCAASDVDLSTYLMARLEEGLVADMRVSLIL